MLKKFVPVIAVAMFVKKGNIAAVLDSISARGKPYPEASVDFGGHKKTAPEGAVLISA
jgi:hypothetical protein